MSGRQFYVGKTPILEQKKTVSGAYVEVEGEVFYRIENADAMRPFFMTVVSSSDHWLFISSNGALSAGRKTPDCALFPYYTDDKITDSAELTGNKTIIRVEDDNKTYLWEPHSDRYAGAYAIKRNIYKNAIGNKILFEEINSDLNLTHQYRWTFSDKYGFVKRSKLINHANHARSIELVDGFQNILPFGVDSGLQNARSTLVDAYKKNELDEETKLGLFTLSAMIIDRAEPSEALKATVAWSVGLDNFRVLLSSMQLDKFRRGEAIKEERQVKAERGSYFVHSEFQLSANVGLEWYVVADINQSMTNIVQLKHDLNFKGSLVEKIITNIAEGTQVLRKKVGAADGIQVSNDKLSAGRHFSNVLFNIMRGGTFDDQYFIDILDLKKYVKNMNKQAYERNMGFLDALPKSLTYNELISRASQAEDVDLERICLEYLPLSFSRRHGDPSRPWNYFSIDTEDNEGRKIRNYEGNWRDIFQNWEALAYSYPDFIEGMITKFVNASTIDGYNPYRITRSGIDWEVKEPDDPWSYIGYWGDHQIIYLQKLMEVSSKFHPEKLRDLFLNPVNVYANVPYRIKGYDAILSNPSDTVDYDHRLADNIAGRVEHVGADGKMIWNQHGQLIRANLTEKILVMVLTKLYNFIPDAGIWLNTQRPEWNDANNALVGNGTSMVTLYYMRRFLTFGIEEFESMRNTEIEINKPVKDLLDALYRAMHVRKHLIGEVITDQERRKIMDRFGIAGEHYRTTAYSGLFNEKRMLKASEIVTFFKLTLQFVEQTILTNKREDGLYHSYNLIHITDGEAKVDRLYEMLEGQVAVLSSGFLSAGDALSVIDALKMSKMFRPDQYSYMLYPDRELPSFFEKNNIPASFIENSPLAVQLMDNDDFSLFTKDIEGNYHFNGNFHNAVDVKAKLTELSQKGYSTLVAREHVAYLEMFEKMFNHKAFTGRSGTFFGYEGLGSIYWHMVSKLLLATQENLYLGHQTEADEVVMGRLIEHYYEIRAGIGVNKSPDLYGAFPTDAYSHTPGNAGAQQPGMTGQVKEDIISRWVELGVVVADGKLSFSPFFLREEEFLKVNDEMIYFDVKGQEQRLALSAGTFGFTYCQLPITYTKSGKASITLIYNDGNSQKIEGNQLTAELSKEIFSRNGRIVRLEVNLS
jgi:hypothetical protein